MTSTHSLCDISDVEIKPLGQSIYMKPVSMHFTHNGKKRKWDMLEVHDSVQIIIFNVTRKVLVLVKQFRPAVYFNSIPRNERMGRIDTAKYPLEKGITLEWCAGIVDKNKPLEEIAKEEILEECGYSVQNIESIGSYRSGVGSTGSIQTAFYCEVTDDMKVHSGGGIDDESIEVVEMTIQEIIDFANQSDVICPASSLYGVHWFLNHKVK